MIGYAGGDSTSQTATIWPSAGGSLSIGLSGFYKSLQFNRSRTAVTNSPEASSTTKYRPAGLTPARFIICARVSGLIPRIRFGSFLYQNSQILYTVGSMVVNFFANLTHDEQRDDTRYDYDSYFASLRFRYFSLLYSVFRLKFA